MTLTRMTIRTRRWRLSRAMVLSAFVMASASATGASDAAAATSPGSTVLAVFQAATAGNFPAACSHYVKPDRNACLSQQGTTFQTSLSLGHVWIVGDDALVGLVGSACSVSSTGEKSCLTNTDGSAKVALPRKVRAKFKVGIRNFNAEFQSYENASLFDAADPSRRPYPLLFACAKNNGVWYVITLGGAPSGKLGF